MEQKRRDQLEDQNLGQDRQQEHQDDEDEQRGKIEHQRAKDLQEAAVAAGQGHVFEGWEELSVEEKRELEEDFKEVDLKYLDAIFKASMAPVASSCTADIQPYKDVLGLQDGSPEQRQEWYRHGLDLIVQGKAAVLLLAGGQGTRLGSTLPKGCFDVGLPSKKSLFQVQAERLKKVQQLAALSVSGGTSAGPPHTCPPGPVLLHWYIMTSPFTHYDTLSHFESHSFFGLDQSQVHFFQQGFLPCLTEQGKIIMASRSRLAKAPDGNGGIYMALHRSGCLDHLLAAGIECLDVYCVDNLLARVADPLFLGYCHSRDAEVGARVVAKAYPEEKVGVFARRNGSLAVLEYSELDPKLASAPDPQYSPVGGSTQGGGGGSTRLLYNWSNICMHYFSTEWLTRVRSHLEEGSPYHVARKSISSKDGPVPGIKLELFIFDTFSTAAPGKLSLMEVDRKAEFAPVKNAAGSATDSPDTARAALLSLHSSWVEAAGGKVTSNDGVEVAPSRSYAGEGLEAVCQGQTFDSSWSEVLQG